MTAGMNNNQPPNASRVSTAASAPPARSRVRDTIRYLRRNPSLIAGMILLLLIVAFVAVGAAVTEPDDANPLSYRPSQPPSAEHWLGTDRLGKDILAVMVEGTPKTIRIGVIAGAIGVAIGTLLAFFSGYYGGIFDTVTRSVIDILRTVPALLVLVILAISLPGTMTVEMMALTIAALAWLGPTRVLRSQVLVIRKQSYVEMARFTGMSGPEIIIKEMMPNLMPFIVAVFVTAVSGAILASIGLEALGLGPFEANTLGMTIYWNIWYASLINGWWWWWAPPIIVIVLLFVGLFLISQGLDEWANPRLRRSV
ncbi:MAG: ABC transporter permease [Caldilineaceae bacterium]|nr:ABC transporter permease [Caldilineaceae bacterium]MCB0083627.1 ABC transporter permease [Caldilineaceae bacterium]